MEVHYQNANYDSGNQSTLFSFGAEQTAQQDQILVDAGPGLDLDEVLDAEEYLSATLLTHAHQDHIVSLDECLRDGASIYASPETVSILETVLDIDSETLGIENPDAVIEQLEPLNKEWKRVTGNLEVRPIPVGHAPGSTGFLLRFSGDNHIFATGDFTSHDVAGNPGFDPTFNDTLQSNRDSIIAELSDKKDDNEKFSIGTLQLNAPSQDAATDELQSAIGTIYQRVLNGSKTIVTTGALGGIHIAGLLNKIQSEQDGEFEIILVGKIAAVYEALDYDFEQVSAVSEFQHPEELLASGQVTVAGPEDASSGSAKRLMEVANQGMGNTTVVQLQSAGTESIEENWITSYNFRYSLHPSEEEIESVVKEINPLQLIVGHTTDKSVLNRWKDKGSDLNTLIWASYGNNRYRLFDDRWLPPKWVNSNFAQTVLQEAEYRADGSVPGNKLPTPRIRQVSLAREGIDIGGILENNDIRTITPEETAGSKEYIIGIDAGIMHLTQLAVDGHLSISQDQIDDSNVDSFVLDSVDWFIRQSIQDVHPKHSLATKLEESIEIEQGTPLAKLLSAERSSETSLSRTVIDVLREEFDLPGETTVEYTNTGLGPRMTYIKAIVNSNETDFTEPSEVVQASIESVLGV